MHFEELINERTYKVVLLTSFIPTLIKEGNVVISIDHYEEMREYFSQEAMKWHGYSVVDSSDFMRQFIEKIVGTKVSLDYFKTDGEFDIPGNKKCYILRIDKNKANKDFLNRNNIYLVNVEIFDKDGNVRKRSDMVMTYNALINELKKCAHLTAVDLVGLNEQNYLVVDEGGKPNATGLNLISLLIDKLRNAGEGKNIIVISENIKSKKNTGNWDPYVWVKQAQNNGILY